MEKALLNYTRIPCLVYYLYYLKIFFRHKKNEKFLNIGKTSSSYLLSTKRKRILEQKDFETR